MSERSRAESPSLKEVLQDPIGAFLKRHPIETADIKGFGLEALSVEHRAEMLGAAYKEVQETSRTEKQKSSVASDRTLKFVASLYADKETREAYLAYWNKFRGERKAVNGSYEQYRELQSNINHLEKEYDELSQALFMHRNERTSELDKMLYQKIKRELKEKRASLEDILEQNPKLAARVSYNRLAGYNEELSHESFIWFPSRRAILEQIEGASLTGRPVLLLGESGTGKTSLVTSAAKNLTGNLPFKNQGGPSTRLQDSLATKGLKGDESCLVYQPMGQAITGKETSLDAAPMHEGGMAFDDEFNNRPKDIQLEIIKSISGIRPGKKARLPLLGELVVQPKFLFVAAGNPPSDRYDREPMDPAVEREFGAPILVDYPEQSLDNPELFEGMLSALMDKNDRLRFAKSELEPPVEKEVDGREKSTVVETTGRSKRTFLDDPHAGGVIWRFSQALDQLYKSFSRKETVLNGKGEGQYLSRFVLDPGVVFGWFRSAVEQGYQGSLEKYLNEKLEATVSGIRSKEDAALAREFLEHFGLLADWTDEKEEALVFTNLTPEEIGLLSPRVKYLKVEPIADILSATAIIDGKPVRYRKATPDEAVVRREPSGVPVTLLGMLKDGTLVVRKGNKTEAALVRREDFESWPLIEKKKGKPAVESPEFKPIYDRARRWIKNYFGEDISVPPLPEGITPKHIKEWKELGFEMRYLPPKTLSASDNFPGWQKKPDQGISLFENLEKIRNLPENQANPNLKGLAPNQLPGAWVLADIRKKPDYQSGNQTYENDVVIQNVLQRLANTNPPIVNQEAAHGRRSHIHPDVFKNPLFWKELKTVLKLNDLPNATVRLPRVIEANVIGQGVDFDGTSTAEWNEEYFQSGRRLMCGDSASGGASGVYWGGRSNAGVGFRPLGRFSP